jgi:putative FmdB family regulatory protein
MPLYTFECTKGSCRHRFDRVFGVNRIQKARPRCPVCGKLARRVFVPPQVIQDTLPEGEVAVSSLKPLEGDTRRVPRVSTRSELKRLVDGNNKKYGLGIEHAR